MHAGRTPRKEDDAVDYEREYFKTLLKNYQTMSSSIFSELFSSIKKIVESNGPTDMNYMNNCIKEIDTESKKKFDQLISFSQEIVNKMKRNKQYLIDYVEIFENMTRSIINSYEKYGKFLNENDYLLIPSLLEHKIAVSKYIEQLIKNCHKTRNELKKRAVMHEDNNAMTTFTIETYKIFSQSAKEEKDNQIGFNFAIILYLFILFAIVFTIMRLPQSRSQFFHFMYQLKKLYIYFIHGICRFIYFIESHIQEIKHSYSVVYDEFDA